MQKQTTLIIIGIVMIVIYSLSGCTSDKGTNLTDFSGITETDSLGNILSEDPDDWCYDQSEYEPPAEFKSSLVGFSFPCSTLGDSFPRNINLINTYPFDIHVEGYCADTAINITPDSFTVASDEARDVSIVYTAFDDTIHGGYIYFYNDSPDSQLALFYEAGAVPFWEQSGAEMSVPASYSLYPAYPNPASEYTNISFSVPEAGSVTVRIFKQGGQEFAKLIDGILEAGRHTVRWDVSAIEPGIYKCFLSFNSYECQGDIQVE